MPKPAANGNYKKLLQVAMSAKSRFTTNTTVERDLNKYIPLCYDHLGKTEKAIVSYEAEYGPNFNQNIGYGNTVPILQCHIGDLCELLGDKIEAKKAYLAVWSSCPEHPPIQPYAPFAEKHEPPKIGSPGSRRITATNSALPVENTLPLLAPRPISPSYNEIKAVAYYLVGRMGMPGYPYDIAHLKVAADLLPTNAVVLWGYAHSLAEYEDYRSSFLEYNLAEKYSYGKVKTAIHEMRRADRMETTERTSGEEGLSYDSNGKFEGRFKIASHSVRMSASDFKNLFSGSFNLRSALGIPSKTYGNPTYRP